MRIRAHRLQMAMSALRAQPISPAVNNDALSLVQVRPEFPAPWNWVLLLVLLPIVWLIFLPGRIMASASAL